MSAPLGDSKTWSKKNCCTFPKNVLSFWPYGYSKEKCILPPSSRSGNRGAGCCPLPAFFFRVQAAFRYRPRKSAGAERGKRRRGNAAAARLLETPKSRCTWCGQKEWQEIQRPAFGFGKSDGAAEWSDSECEACYGKLVSTTLT